MNRNHFAGYLVMATPLAIGFALEALSRLRAAWGRRRRGWLLLGEQEGNAVARWAAVVMVLVAGLLASQSRGGVSAFAAAALLCRSALAREAAGPRSAVSLLVGLGVAWIGLGGVLSAFETRGVRASRLDLWRDMLPDGPALPGLRRRLERVRDRVPVVPDRLADGVDRRGAQRLPAGPARRRGRRAALLVAGLLARRLPRGARPRPALARSTSASSAPSSASPSTSLVDFNGQIPANAATWIGARRPRRGGARA